MQLNAALEFLHGICVIIGKNDNWSKFPLIPGDLVSIIVKCVAGWLTHLILSTKLHTARLPDSLGGNAP